MTYSIKETHYTLQGEGVHAGRPAVFIRFTGCNLWSGREADRDTAICRFCDTDFVGTDGPGGGTFESAVEVASSAKQLWPEMSGARPFAVCTGGEPLLQLDRTLVEALHAAGFEVAIETNGTLEAPDGIDWTCVSPKAGAGLRLTKGHELKMVFPQPGMDPGQFEGLGFQHFLLQPMAGPELERYSREAVEYCLKHPRWRLSVQLHKILGIP